MKPWLPFLLLITKLNAGILYTTDFEDFAVGDNNWIGTEGWTGLGLSNTNGISSIEDDYESGVFEKTAKLGGRQPLPASGGSSFPRASVFRFYDHNHVTTGEPIIYVETLISISYSSEGREPDNFYFSIFNSVGTRLAAIRFDNQSIQGDNPDFGIWREDGQEGFDTGFDFVDGEIYDLFLTINLENNTWSAKLGIPQIGDALLFSNKPFTSVATGDAINFGLAGYEWGLNSTNPAEFGDNAIRIIDLLVESSPPSIATPILALNKNSSDQTILTWTAEAGINYKVQYSTDLSTWMDDLPNSTIQANTNGPESYTDNANPALRFYRVIATRPNS